MTQFKEGDLVRWAWGQGHAEGKIQSIFSNKTTRKIRGSEITRNGTKEDPALYIKQQDGGAVLKLTSEVEKS